MCRLVQGTRLLIFEGPILEASPAMTGLLKADFPIEQRGACEGECTFLLTLLQNPAKWSDANRRGTFWFVKGEIAVADFTKYFSVFRPCLKHSCKK